MQCTVELKECLNGITTPESYVSLEFQYTSAIAPGNHTVYDLIFFLSKGEFYGLLFEHF